MKGRKAINVLTIIHFSSDNEEQFVIEGDFELLRPNERTTTCHTW